MSYTDWSSILLFAALFLSIYLIWSVKHGH